MNLNSQFEQCQKFLSPWEKLLEVEALKHYPKQWPELISDWLTNLEKFNYDQLWQFQHGLINRSLLTKSLDNFLQKQREITSFEKYKISSRELELRFSPKVKPKKRHEIQAILSLVDDLRKVDTVIDIGGGVGHLSLALVRGKTREAFSIDLNREFQEAGHRRLEKWDKESLKKITFLNTIFDSNFRFQEISHAHGRLVIGLHSCGELGTNAIEFCMNQSCENLVLASCCYHKLAGAYNISKSAKRMGLDFSLNALHLASRCNRQENYLEFSNKIKLRRYRYALHLLEYERGQKEFVAIGNTKLSDYNLSFYHYVQKYSSFGTQSELEIESFYAAKSTQKSIREIIHVDILRAFLGRVVESYLILDRALFLEEHNYRVRILEAFDPQISPRNLVIVAQS